MIPNRAAAYRIFRLSGLIILWRAILFALGAAAAFLLTYKPSFPYAYSRLPDTHLPRWLYSWANFDGVHYLTIIKEGYLKTELIQVFFPAFPILARILTFSGISPIMACLILGNLAMLLLSFMWFHFLSYNFSRQQAFRGVLLLITFPTAFYLGAVYSESIFMLLSIGAFYAAGKKRWLITGALVALATATKVVGIVLVPALLLEIYLQTNKVETLADLWQIWKRKDVWPTIIKTLKNKREIALVLLGSLGLLGYMLYLQLNFGDPLYFFHVQNEFGGFRSESLVMYPQVVWRSIKILATNALDWRYLTYFQEALAGIGGMIALLWALKSVRLSWVIYSLGIIIIPTLTGTFSSMPRYLLPAFALQILLIQIFSKYEKLFYLYLAISAVLLAINTMLFIQGYWVA